MTACFAVAFVGSCNALLLAGLSLKLGFRRGPLRGPRSPDGPGCRRGLDDPADGREMATSAFDVRSRRSGVGGLWVA